MQLDTSSNLILGQIIHSSSQFWPFHAKRRNATKVIFVWYIYMQCNLYSDLEYTETEIDFIWWNAST